MDRGRIIPVLDHGFVEYIDHLGDDEVMVEAARGNLNRHHTIEEDIRLLTILFKQRQPSIFAMANVKLGIKLPISMLSIVTSHCPHYVERIGVDCAFFFPEEFRERKTNQPGKLDQLRIKGALAAVYKFTKNHYDKLSEEGVASEHAALVLPMGLYTEFETVWDLGSLLQFFCVQDKRGKPEAREYTKAMKAMAYELFPATIEIYETAMRQQQEETAISPAKTDPTI